MTTPSDDVTGELLPECHPAWEIQIGWEMHMEDGAWHRVTGRIDLTSKVPERDDRVVFLLGQHEQCMVEASDMLMVRAVPGPPVRTRDMTPAEVDQVKADFAEQAKGDVTPEPAHPSPAPGPRGGAPTMTLYGPHCSHDECSWMECEDARSEHPCSGQDTCPRCGPNSPQWPRFARGMAEFLREWYGTVNEQELRAKLVDPNVDYSNVFRYARLLRLHGRVVGEPAEAGTPTGGERPTS